MVWFSTGQAVLITIGVLGIAFLAAGAYMLATNYTPSTITLSVVGLVLCVIGIAFCTFSIAFFTGVVSVRDSHAEYMRDFYAGNIGYQDHPALAFGGGGHLSYRNAPTRSNGVRFLHLP